MSVYNLDLKECEELSDQVSSSKQAAKEGAFGAVVHGALAAAIGGDTEEAVSVGAISGAASGASKGSIESGQVLRNCLRGRGYNVLN